MPEMPEVQGLVDFLGERAVGHAITRTSVGEIAALKTYDPPNTALHGATITATARYGKFVDIACGDDLHLVLRQMGQHVEARAAAFLVYLPHDLVVAVVELLERGARERVLGALGDDLGAMLGAVAAVVAAALLGAGPVLPEILEAKWNFTDDGWAGRCPRPPPAS